MFELFDPGAEVVVTHGNLPHWYQPGVTYFVTFRTDDSIPKAVSQLWHRRRDEWLRHHRLDPTSPEWRARLRTDPELEHEFHRQFTREFMDNLDRGYGECLLREPQLAKIVAESLLFFDDSRYELGDFVVMPNHVHLLVCLRGMTEIQSQCRSWKRFTAAEINKAIGRNGRFWQEESFDHLVRSPAQFDYLRRYIASNPITANLPPNAYLFRRNET